MRCADRIHGRAATFRRRRSRCSVSEKRARIRCSSSLEVKSIRSKPLSSHSSMSTNLASCKAFIRALSLMNIATNHEIKQVLDLEPVCHHLSDTDRGALLRRCELHQRLKPLQTCSANLGNSRTLFCADIFQLENLSEISRQASVYQMGNDSVRMRPRQDTLFIYQRCMVTVQSKVFVQLCLWTAFQCAK